MASKVTKFSLGGRPAPYRTVARRTDVCLDQITGDAGVRREWKRLHILDADLTGRAKFTVGLLNWRRVDREVTQGLIRAGIEQAQSRYSGKPPRQICLMADELTKPRPAKQVSDGGGAGIVYKCNVEGDMTFSDYRYKSFPCKDLNLPGYRGSRR